MNGDVNPGAVAAAEEVARTSYGRLLAYLSARSGDVAGAEDALGEALFRAVRHWPAGGVPPHPEAWLLRVARNHLIDEARKRRVRADAQDALWRAAEEAQRMAELADDFPDERLKLLFVCAHPAIDPAVRTPLMLQTVLGFDAARIASAFLVAPTTMGQRLVRAKAKIRDAGIAFEVPGRDELPERLEAVLEAVYAVYGQGWDDLEAGAGRESLVAEALWLARLMVRLLPDEPEPRGLLSLILFCESRRPARRAAEGAFVPLSQQDTAFWSRPMMEEADRHLSAAAERRKMGRFQLEAAIQSVHAARAVTGRTDWQAIAYLYEGLLRFAPTVGALVGHAAAVAEWQGAEAGLSLLDALPSDDVKTYQAFWAVRAHLLRRVGRIDDARRAYDIAAGLTADAALRDYLLEQRRTLS